MRKLLFVLLLSISIPCFSLISFEEVMTREQMQKTGVFQLNYSQRKALEDWINNNFEPKTGVLVKDDEQLYLSFNIDDGEKLELSDGSTYEIAPEDRLYTVYWITPFPVRLGDSNNPKYPVKITNMTTGTSVKGKRISTQQMLQEEEEKQKALPPQPSPEQPAATPKTSPSPQPNNGANGMKKPPQQQKPTNQQQQ